MIDRRTERLNNQRTIADHPVYRIIKMDQNTEKIPGDLRRFAVTPVKNSQGINLNLTMQTNGICTTQNLSKKMTHINSYGTLTYTRIT